MIEEKEKEKEKEKVFEASKNYETESYFDKKLIEYRYEVLAKYLVGETCLELGPGSGCMTNLLCDRFSSVTAVDASELVLQQLPKRDNLYVVNSLFEDLQLDKHYDSVILEHILEHVELPTQLLALAKKLVSPGGRIFVGVPNSESIHRLAAVKMGLLARSTDLNERDIKYGHRRVYSKESLKIQLIEAGLTIEFYEGVFLKPLTNGQIDKYWTPEMMDGFFKLSKLFPDNTAEIMFVCSAG